MRDTVNNRQAATVHFKIVDENNKPVQQQALVRATSQANGRVLFQMSHSGEAVIQNMMGETYLVEVGAPGYLPVHEQFVVSTNVSDVYETVHMRRDPAAVDFSAQNAAGLSSKFRKEAEKGVQSLELGDFLDAKKHLQVAQHHSADNAWLNFLLGYIAIQQKDSEHAFQYLSAAAKLDPQDVRTQSLLGRLYCDRGDYKKAVEAELSVLAKNPDSPIAHQVLATSYLQLRDYENARQQAQWEVDRGGAEGTNAKLILGQALAGLQKVPDAITTLKAFLQSQPSSSAAPSVRKLIAELETRAARPSDGTSIDLIGDPSLRAETEADFKAGMPPDVDAQRVSLVPGVQCPSNVLSMAEHRSKELVDSVAQFSAVEEIVHEGLTLEGTPRSRETRRFNYVAAITEPEKGPLRVEEFREMGARDTMPENISTTGLSVLALAFHPKFQNEFDVRCEGLGSWAGQPAWLLHFRQRDDKPPELRSYVINRSVYPVPLKGRAWLGAESFQLLHIETDLLQPIPDIRLYFEHTSVTFGPVRFASKNIDLWLPMSADMYVSWHKHRFHRNESFDHFMLFATDAMDKPKLPTTETKTGPTEEHGGGPHQF